MQSTTLRAELAHNRSFRGWASMADLVTAPKGTYDISRMTSLCVAR